jgi:hypothetical protein
MNTSKRHWLPGLVAILLLIGVPVWYFTAVGETVRDTPWEFMPQRAAHVDHKDLYTGEFTTGPEVTAACLECHEDAGEQVLHTAHWRWESKLVEVEGREEPISTGKKIPSITSVLVSRVTGQSVRPVIPAMVGMMKTLILRIRAILTAWPAMTTAAPTLRARQEFLLKALT